MCCRATGVDPKTVRRERPPDHVDIRKKTHEIAGTRRRFGYPLAGNGLHANRERRRVGILLEREGFTMNEKKLYCLYREEGLSMRRRRGGKRARGTRAPMPIPNRPDGGPDGRAQTIFDRIMARFTGQQRKRKGVGIGLHGVISLAVAAAGWWWTLSHAV